MISPTITLSVIIPVYNEARRLQNLKIIHRYLRKLSFKTELIVVNDGSTDGTEKLLQANRHRANYSLISYPLNRGKGYAIREGMKQARGRYRLFMDIDLSVPLAEIPRFLKVATTADILIATRKIRSSRVVIHQPLPRELMGRLFTWLSKTLLSLQVSDFTCGFKLFSAATATAIFTKAQINRWGFDSEVLYLAHHLHYTVREMPVTWRNDPLSQVKFPQDIIRSLIELATIYWYSRTGKYS